MTGAPSPGDTSPGPIVRFVYCTSCNYSRRALWLAGEVMAQLEHSIAGLEILGGSGGVFDVTLDGEPVFSKGASGRFPEPEELTLRLFELLEAASA